MDKIICCGVVIAAFVAFGCYLHIYQIRDQRAAYKKQKHQRYMLAQKVKLLDAEAAKAHECRLAAEAFRDAIKMLGEGTQNEEAAVSDYLR